jgi:hypothetical protein
MLIAHATSQQRTPVFKFCRSLGRLPWFRETFPDAVHVVVAKNPLMQWQSCWDLFALHRNAHFVALPFMVLAFNRRVPIVEQVLSSLQIALPRELQSTGELSIDDCLAVYKAHVARITPADAYRAFVGYWLLTLRHAVTQADAVFDCDLAMGSREYLTAVEDWIARMSGLRPSLRSARSGGAAGRHWALDVAEGAAIHLAAIECGRTLMREASVPAEALSLWAGKLVEATLSLSADENGNSAQSRIRAASAIRIADLAVADSFGRDTVIACGLATTRAALGAAIQLHDSPRGMFAKLTSSTSRLLLGT